MSKQRYKEYTESGVQWLGQLPNHWEVKRLKYSTVSCQNGVWGEEPEGDENDIICVRVADFDREKIRVSLTNPTIRNVAATHRVSRAVQKGDLLLEKSGGGEKQPVGFVALYDEDQPAVCSNFVACMKLMHGMVPSFWRYVHAAGYSVGLNIRSIKQTSGIQNIDQASYLNERAPFPPLEEQQKVAAFLDRKTTEIDTLIAKNRRLLDRLAEKRTALITRAVTKGLNSDAPMKDSGIEWLGEIPAHWSLQPVYARYSVQLGKMLDERRISGDSLVQYLRNVDVQWDKINYDGLPEMDVGEAEYERYLVQEGDLLVCEGGEIGRSAIVGKLSGLTAYQKALHRLRPIREAEHPRYMFYTLFSAATNGVLSVGGVSTISHLTAEQIRRFRFPTPPDSEQGQIANFLDRSLAELDEAFALAEVAIDRLHEYRSALITNAVTGQIKVA